MRDLLARCAPKKTWGVNAQEFRRFVAGRFAEVFGAMAVAFLWRGGRRGELLALGVNRCAGAQKFGGESDQ
jgi:hypothetical protein